MSVSDHCLSLDCFAVSRGICRLAEHTVMQCRRVFEALVSVLDNALGQIVAALEARRAWNPLLHSLLFAHLSLCLFPRFRRCME